MWFTRKTLARDLLALPPGAFFDDDAPQTRNARIFNLLLAALIGINPVGVTMESIKSILARYPAVLVMIEQTATAKFAVEYVP